MSEKKSRIKKIHFRPLNLVYTNDPQKGKILEINMSPIQIVIYSLLTLLALVFGIKKLVKAIKRAIKKR